MFNISQITHYVWKMGTKIYLLYLFYMDKFVIFRYFKRLHCACRYYILFCSTKAWYETLFAIFYCDGWLIIIL